VEGTLQTLVYSLQHHQTLHEWNPDVNELINFVDSISYELFVYLISQNKNLEPFETKRLACYQTLLSGSPLVPLINTPLIPEFDSIAYFKPILPNLVPHTVMKRQYKIAFLIMVHDIGSYYQTVQLLGALEHPEVIFLLHVDSKSNEMYVKLKRWSQFKDNVHMAVHRFSNIWGHISLVYTQLCGSWELYDLGDWSHIINLSADDWPLISTAQMIEYLEMNRNSSFIRHWFETTDLASRLGRSFVARTDRKKTVDIPQLGVSGFYMKAYKHHQWMVVHRDAIAYLRSRDGLKSLAQFEFSYIPDESFFGTALLNSPLAASIKNEHLRYIRINGAHPDWLGYKDRFYFPISKERPTFFIRKFKLQGDFFEERKLVEWIHEEQHDKSCRLDRISGDTQCLADMIRNRTASSHVIMIAVNQGFMQMVQNLECSIQMNTNSTIVYWSLDIPTHEYFLRTNRLSIFLPGTTDVTGLHAKHSQPLIKMLSSKPLIVEMILDAGYSVMVLDGDCVVRRDFDLLRVEADVNIALENMHYLSGMGYNPTASIMYFRNTIGARMFLTKWKKEIARNSHLNDSESLKRALRDIVVLDPSISVAMVHGTQKMTVKYLDGNAFMTIDEDRFTGNPFIVHAQSNNPDRLKSIGLWYMNPHCSLATPEPKLTSI
jgi:hypothetical protein